MAILPKFKKDLAVWTSDVQVGVGRPLSAGFTLIEVLVVIGILMMIIGLGLLVSFDSYRGYLFRSERSVVVAVLERARSKAMNNIHQCSWGARYDSAQKQYIIYNTACTPAAMDETKNETIPAGGSAEVLGFNPIVFNQLSGAAAPMTITIKAAGHADENVEINSEGRINW